MQVKFQLKDKRIVYIVIDEDDYQVCVLDDQRKHLVGKMIFLPIELPGYPPMEVLFLKWMYMNLHDASYKRQGIGRKCLQLVRECSGMNIVTSESNGHKRDDGGHLTGDAPAFVAKMRTEGII